MKSYPIPTLTAEEQERFWSKVDKTSSTSGCWLWNGSKTKGLHGGGWYGLFTVRIDGKNRYLRPHRVAYTLLVGPIPDGLTLDHRKDLGCTSTLCCNPAHLEAVTQTENHLRHYLQRKTCRRGHPWKPLNGRRACPICIQMKTREWQKANREHLAAYNRERYHQLKEQDASQSVQRNNQ